MEYIVNSEDIRVVLEELGGRASVEDIRRKILANYTGGEVPSNYSSFITFRATVQRKIENHCPEADDFDHSREVYFKRVGHGVYELIKTDKKITYSPAGKSEIQTPHKYPKYGGKYVVSESKFVDDYEYVDTIEELSAFIEAGYSVRMSNGKKGASPSLIIPSSLDVEGGKSSKKSLIDELKRLSYEDLESSINSTARKEQSLLRGFLLDGKPHGQCHICGDTFPSDLLVAGSTLILRTLQRSLIMGKRSVYVKEKKIQSRVQTGCC